MISFGLILAPQLVYVLAGLYFLFGRQKREKQTSQTTNTIPTTSTATTTITTTTPPHPSPPPRNTTANDGDDVEKFSLQSSTYSIASIVHALTAAVALHIFCPSLSLFLVSFVLHLFVKAPRDIDSIIHLGGFAFYSLPMLLGNTPYVLWSLWTLMILFTVSVVQLFAVDVKISLKSGFVVLSFIFDLFTYSYYLRQYQRWYSLLPCHYSIFLFVCLLQCLWFPYLQIPPLPP